MCGGFELMWDDAEGPQLKTSKLVCPDSVLLNYNYFRGTDCNVHFFDIINERINFVLQR